LRSSWGVEPLKALRAGFSPVLFALGWAGTSGCRAGLWMGVACEVVHEDGIEPPTIPV
jgi:hypothetical protein